MNSRPIDSGPLKDTKGNHVTRCEQRWTSMKTRRKVKEVNQKPIWSCQHENVQEDGMANWIHMCPLDTSAWIAHACWGGCDRPRGRWTVWEVPRFSSLSLSDRFICHWGDHRSWAVEGFIKGFASINRRQLFDQQDAVTFEYANWSAIYQRWQWSPVSGILELF